MLPWKKLTLFSRRYKVNDMRFQFKKILGTITCATLTINTLAQAKDDSLLNSYLSQIQSHQQEIDKIKATQDGYNSMVNITLIGLGTLLTIGTGFSIVGFIKTEKRESTSFRLTLESVQEAKAASFESKENENRILAESQKTLSLVNETLTLATEASKRASKSLETRLRRSILNLENDSKEVVEYSGAFEDDKNLTTDKSKCSDIHRIGRKIEGIENNLVILGDATLDDTNTQGLNLKPYCNFIRGTDSYLSEQFSEAVEYWKAVTNSADSETKLQSLAYYWMGYINNNLGDFNKAKNSFNKAFELANDSRKFELRRIQLETRFFNHEPIKDIVDEFEILLRSISTNHLEDSLGVLQLRESKILTTLGNIYYQWGNEVKEKEEAQKCFVKSSDIFTKLLQINPREDILSQLHAIPDGKKDKLKWVIFGYVESLYKVAANEQDLEIAKSIYKDIVYVLAENEFLNREEKRTKVLAKTTQLICAVRCTESPIIINNHKSQVENILGDIDRRLTIYSQMQRRNVKREVFREDLEAILTIGS